jgi:hypothetical protein
MNKLKNYFIFFQDLLYKFSLNGVIFDQIERLAATSQ